MFVVFKRVYMFMYEVISKKYDKYMIIFLIIFPKKSDYFACVIKTCFIYHELFAEVDITLIMPNC